MTIKNAVIKSTQLTTEAHGMLSAWLILDYGETSQGFGGYVLYLPKSFDHHKLESVAGHFIFRCIEIAGVTEWERLTGRTIRVDLTSEFGDILGIGHIIKDDWFYPKKDFEGMKS